MVDLRQSLRPTGTVTPPPVAEIAARASRRRRRRMAAVSGTIAVVAAIGLALATDALSRSTPSATVADGVVVDPAASDAPGERSSPPPSSTIPTTSSPSPAAADGQPRDSGTELPPSPPDDESTTTSLATTATGDGTADDAPPPGPELVASPGLRTTATLTSSWESGYCLQIDVDNETAEPVIWEVFAGLGGEIDEYWNSTVEAAGGDAVFTGEAGYNVVLEAGASTSFGACIDTTGRDRGQASITGGSAGSADR